MFALVTGATGLIGRHLVDVLVENGVQTRVFVRSSSDLSPLKTFKIDIVAGDAVDETALQQAMQDVDLLFHVAGYLTTNAPFGINGNREDDDWPLYQAINVDFTEALLQASWQAGVARFIYVSSSSVYSIDAVVPTAEDALLRPLSMYGRSKLLAEQLVQSYQKKGLPTTIIRPPITYGPGDRYFTPLALKLARLPLLPLINGGRTLMDLVFVRDVAQLMWQAARSEVGNGRIYNAGPDVSTTLFDLVDAYRQLTGDGPRILSVSPQLARHTAWLSRRLVKPFLAEADALLTAEGVTLMSRDLHLDMTRAAEELAYHPRFSLLDGLALTLAST